MENFFHFCPPHKRGENEKITKSNGLSSRRFPVCNLLRKIIFKREFGVQKISKDAFSEMSTSLFLVTKFGANRFLQNPAKTL